MQKHAFNVLGVLIVITLFVLLGVGSVSADSISVTTTIDIIDGTYFKVLDSNSQYVSVPYETDLGALAYASLENYGNYTYTLDVVKDSVSTIYNITSLGGIESNETHRWIVFVGGQYRSTSSPDDNQTTQSLSSPTYVEAFFVEKCTYNYATAKINAIHSVNVTVTSITNDIPTTEVSVSLTSGTFTKTDINGNRQTFENLTGIGALQVAAELKYFDYDFSVSGYGAYIPAIYDLGLSKADQTKFGYDYSWAIYVDDSLSYSYLDNLQVATGNKITLLYCLGSYGLEDSSNSQTVDGLRIDGQMYCPESTLVRLNITINSVEFDGLDNSVPELSSAPATSNILWWEDMAETHAGENYEFVPDGSPVVKDGAVYFTAWGGFSSQNGVYCYDINTGEKRWSKTGITSRSGVAVYGNYLYVGYMETENGENIGGVKCLDITKAGEEVGDTEKICKITNSAYVGLTSTPLVLGGYVWIYSPTSYGVPANAVLYCYDKTLSKQLAAIELGAASGGMYASPAISDDGKTIYVPGGEGIVAVNTSSNTVRWTYDVDAADYSVGTPAYHDGNVYFMVAGSPGKLYKVTDNGESYPAGWNVDHNAEFPTTPVIDNTKIYATGSEGLSAYLLTNGEKRWTHYGGNAVRASPTLSTNGIIYYGTYSEGTLYAVANDSSQKWKLKPYSPSGRDTIFEARPAVLDGVLYVGCEGASTFYAISDSGEDSSLLEQKQLQQRLMELQEKSNELHEQEIQLLQQQLYYLQQQGTTTEQSDETYTLINPGSGTVTYTTNHPSYPKTTFTFDRMTVAGVLLASGNNVVTAERWGGLYISSINGKSSDNDPSGGWLYQVNGKSVSSMPNNCRVTYGDTVVFYYSASMDSTPATSSYVYSYKVSTNTATTPIKSETVETPTPTPTPTPTETEVETPPLETVPSESIPTQTSTPESSVTLLGTILGFAACLLIRRNH